MNSTDEQSFEFEGSRIAFRRLDGAGERGRHLLVIFSGFRPTGAPYDFALSSARSLGCDVLWIRDEFDGRETYYLRRAGSDVVQRAVGALITSVMAELGVAPESITAAGFSKGGTAALVHGLTMGLGSVLAVVPQLRVGTYTRDHWPEVFAHMTSSGSDEDHAALDAEVLTQIDRASGERTHVYVVSSSADPTHDGQLGQLLSDLRALRHFNLIMTEWPSITKHVDVTPQNRHFVLALLTMLADGLRPSFGEVVVGEDVSASDILGRQWSALDHVVSIDSIALASDGLHVVGAAFYRGRPAAHDAEHPPSLVLSAGGEVSRWPLKMASDAQLSTDFFFGAPCDYARGRWRTAPIGASLSGLAPGTLTLQIVPGTADRRQPLSPTRLRTGVGGMSAHGDRGYVLRRSGLEIQVLCVDLLSPQPSSDSVVRWDTIRTEGALLFVEGRYAVAGLPVKEWGDAHYWLVLRGSAGVHSFPLGLLHRPEPGLALPSPSDYDKAYFSTLRGAGIDTSDLPPGEYEIHVTIMADGTSFTAQAPQKIVVSGVFASTRQARLRVSMVGSCVSRDNFNGSIRPDWRHAVDLGPAIYQASFLSIFGTPQPLPGGAFVDLDEHSRKCVVAEYEKRYIDDMVAWKPDVLLVDFFADTRFDVVPVGDGFITDNDWKIATSRDYSILADLPRIGLGLDPDAFIVRWRDAARQLGALLAEHSPSTRVVVNSARGALSWRDEEGESHEFPQGAVAEFNAKWSALEEIFLEELPGTVVIRPMVDDVQGDSLHPLGKYWVHYTPEFYGAFDRMLKDSFGYRREITLID